MFFQKEQTCEVLQNSITRNYAQHNFVCLKQHVGESFIEILIIDQFTFSYYTRKHVSTCYLICKYVILDCHNYVKLRVIEFCKNSMVPATKFSYMLVAPRWQHSSDEVGHVPRITLVLGSKYIWYPHIQIVMNAVFAEFVERLASKYKLYNNSMSFSVIVLLFEVSYN